MIATSIRTRDFPKEPDEGFFQGLAALAEELKYNVPGFVQAYFLRDRDGGAMVMALWESERVVDEVLESEIGKYAREFHDRYLSGDGTPELLDISWQAVYADEFSKLAKRRREVDPAPKKGRRD